MPRYFAGPYFVGQSSGEERSNAAAQKHRGNIEAGRYAVRVESLFEAIDRSVDDSAIEAEQKPADGGDEADHDNESCVGGVFFHGCGWAVVVC
jgi:hypothetical protein